MVRKPSPKIINETVLEQADDHFHNLLQAQRDSDSFLKNGTVTDQSDIAFPYTEKNLSDIEKFSCKSTEARVFAVDITFNLCIL